MILGTYPTSLSGVFSGYTEILLYYINSLNMATKELPTALDNHKGLHSKFSLQKIIAYTNKKKPIYVDTLPNEEYFVLRLDEHQCNKEHLRACKAAIQSYANVIGETQPLLAQEIIERYINK